MQCSLASLCWEQSPLTMCLALSADWACWVGTLAPCHTVAWDSILQPELGRRSSWMPIPVCPLDMRETLRLTSIRDDSY